MARETLLEKVPIPPQNVHRLAGEKPPEQAAAEYEILLRTIFNLKPDELPRFDLILLGLGPDGHTASLFPGTDVLHEKGRLVTAPFVEKHHAYRLTLTPPVLNHAAHIIFLVEGEAKALALREILQGDRDPDRLPAQLIQPDNGLLAWLVDRAAASHLAGVRWKNLS
ncbi:MAG: 6-phosphogluconolactonase [Chloroflexi bacterium RBG_16_57_9]|nr:MAG: 6-phosphogluconolactonase [Chloroflexi bacterium RBG_16_57_9]